MTLELGNYCIVIPDQCNHLLEIYEFSSYLGIILGDTFAENKDNDNMRIVDESN